MLTNWFLILVICASRSLQLTSDSLSDLVSLVFCLLNEPVRAFANLVTEPRRDSRRDRNRGAGEPELEVLVEGETGAGVGSGAAGV